jgi:aspartate racemase
MKTIGVLGGVEPQATIDFEARVHREAQRLLPPGAGRSYPPMVVYYGRQPPILLTKKGTPKVPIRPDVRLLEAARRLGDLADLLAIPCNRAHLVEAEIKQAAGCPVVSMIAATLEEVRRRHWKRVGVLGVGELELYIRPLERLGLDYELVESGTRAALDTAIFQLKGGRDDAESAAVARGAVMALRARGVDGVVLGCTEIPLLLRETADATDLINPAHLLAEAVVRAALQPTTPSAVCPVNSR